MGQYRTQFETKSVDAAQRIITGHAAVTGNLDRVEDVIEPGAFTATLSEKTAKDVAVFIAHDSQKLTVGLPLRIEQTPDGLLTETYIWRGAEGDNLLDKTADMLAHGEALGMSIGYRVRPGGSQYERREGKTIRRLKAIDLLEYSFAPRQTIANPKALVLGVKQMGDAGMGMRIEQRGDDWVIVADDGDLEDLYPTEAEAQAALAKLQAEEAGEQDDEGKALWSTAQVNDLPDSAFLLVEDGGQKDATGRTVPRSKRHFPYKTASGAIDLPHLRNALARIPQAQVPGFDAAAQSRLQAKARRYLEQAQSGAKAGTLDWGTDTAVDVRAAGYALLDLSEAITRDQAALSVLGLDLKAGRAMSNANLGQLHRAMQEQQRLHSTVCDMGAECPLQSNAAKALAHARRRLQLLEV